MACTTQTPNIDPPVDQGGFNFGTTQKVQLEVSVSALGEAAPRAPISVFQGFAADGTVDENTQVQGGMTDATGTFRTQLTLPADLKAVGVRVDYIGVISEPIKVDIKNGQAKLNLNGTNISTLQVMVPQNRRASATAIRTQSVAYSYQYLNGTGSWDSQGVPTNRLSNSSEVTPALLQSINASVPERASVPNSPSRSQYIAQDASSNLVLKDPAEVTLTFIHEGAGYLNSIGYYTFNAANPPKSVSEILNRTVIAYPNASYIGSGGGMASGNRVQLKYLDTSNGQWSNTFPAGTGIGWFLVANGWRGSATGVQERTPEQTVFSDPVLNYQTYKSQGMTVAKSAQTVLLRNAGTNGLVLGLEDTLRFRGGDEDFNDTVLLVNATPNTAIQTTGIITRDPQNPDATRTADIKDLDTPQAQDADGDGVNDTFDAYPNDPTKAFNSYAPAKGDYGSLVFEDLWPKLGDYDFNDTAVDYNVTQVANASNQVVEIQAEFVLRALGGGYHSGFGFETNLTPAQVSSVSYAWEKDGQSQNGAPPIRYTSNRLSSGLEAGQGKAVVIVFDDGYDVLSASLPGRPYYANVVPDEPYRTPGKVKVTIKLAQPVAMGAAGTAPFNPFLIANGAAWGRGTEIHLPNMKPTALANTSLFGTDQDTSNPSTGRYYIDTNGRPWAMNLPTKYTYVEEVLDQPGGSVSVGLNIRDAYLKFEPWATSQGASFQDWYRDLSGYRDSGKLFPPH